ncbi:hypothetical protein ABOM_000257, partial [Aspergillus bombycis]
MARKRKTPPSIRRRSPIRWTAQEDGILFKTVHACTIRGEDQSPPSDPKKTRKDTIAWKLVAQSLPERTNRDCRKRWFKIDRRWVQGPWAPDEETRLREAVAIYGPGWDEVSFSVKTRNPDQCLEHWEKTLHPIVASRSREKMDDIELLDVVGHQSSYGQTGLAGRPISEIRNRAMSICWQQNPLQWRPEIPQVATVFGQQVIMGNATYNPTIVPQENPAMLDIYQQPFGQPTSEHRTICGNGLTEQSVYARNSHDVPRVSTSYMRPIHEESRYFQAQAPSLGLGALAME